MVFSLRFLLFYRTFPLLSSEDLPQPDGNYGSEPVAAGGSRFVVLPQRARALSHIEIAVLDLAKELLFSFLARQDRKAKNVPDEGIGRPKRGIFLLKKGAAPFEHALKQCGMALLIGNAEEEGIILAGLGSILRPHKHAFPSHGIVRKERAVKTLLPHALRHFFPYFPSNMLYSAALQAAGEL